MRHVRPVAVLSLALQAWMSTQEMIPLNPTMERFQLWRSPSPHLSKDHIVSYQMDVEDLLLADAEVWPAPDSPNLGDARSGPRRDSPTQRARPAKQRPNPLLEEMTAMGNGG